MGNIFEKAAPREGMGPNFTFFSATGENFENFGGQGLDSFLLGFKVKK